MRERERRFEELWAQMRDNPRRAVNRILELEAEIASLRRERDEALKVAEAKRVREKVEATD